MYSIGHSTHALDHFLTLLRAHGITHLADVRLVPTSRRHPHFSGESLAVQLPRHGVEYRHYRELGGHRRPRPDSVNGAWQNESFRGYADYLETSAFAAALDALLAWQREADGRVAMMCAEAVWWRCHRQLIADALVIRGHEVWHITGTSRPARHALTSFARVTEGRLTYPAVWDPSDPAASR